MASVPAVLMVCSALKLLEGLSWWLQDGMTNSDFYLTRVVFFLIE